MTTPFLSPLGWNTPIVDAKGRPTPEFQQKWRKLFQIAQTIPDASSATAMSLLLDLIANDEGDILRRGGLAWNGLASPGGTTKFLRADGSYAVPPDTTYSLATDDDSGLMPALSGTATQYLDGTGAWSTPAGGGGGGGAWALIDSVSAPTSGALALTGLDLSAYTTVRMILSGITVTSDDSEVKLTFYTGGSEVTSGYRFRLQGLSSSGSSDTTDSQSTSAIYLNSTSANWGVGNAATKSFGGDYTAFGLASSTLHKLVSGQAVAIGPSDSLVTFQSAGALNNAGVVDGVRVSGSSNLTAGSLTLLGM